MTNKQQNKSVTYINLCSNNQEVESIINQYFTNQQFTVISFLKELNNYVTITTDFPINRQKLLKKLDPYRKYCNTILLIIIFDKNQNDLNFPWNLTEFGISDIVCINDLNQITEHLSTHFNHYLSINKLITSTDLKKTTDIRLSISSNLN